MIKKPNTNMEATQYREAYVGIIILLCSKDLSLE